MIEIKETTLKIVCKVNSQIPEFSSTSTEDFQKRLNDLSYLAIAGFVDQEPVGYIVSYDRYQDGSYYCWMAGVIPQYRELGILTKMMDYLYSYAKKKGYKKIMIKTRNDKRQMLTYLVKNGYNFLKVEEKTALPEYKISLEKELFI